MPPTIKLNPDRSITMTWFDLHEAWETAEVIKSAGLRRGKIVDSGFYHDGVDLQNLIAEALVFDLDLPGEFASADHRKEI